MSSLGLESLQLEERPHAFSHEAGSLLALSVQDIETLLARLQVRGGFAVFTRSQFERIIEHGWSTDLIKELSPQLPGLSLPELSPQIKSLCSAWSNLPKVAAS